MGVKSSTEADANGNWITEIDTPKAGDYSMKITDGIKTEKIKDILIGEVWLHQVNQMEMPLEGYLPAEPIDNADEEILNSLNDNIRMFTVTNNVTLSKIDAVDGKWLSNPKNSRYFSATGYFFAKKLQKILTCHWNNLVQLEEHLPRLGK